MIVSPFYSLYPLRRLQLISGIRCLVPFYQAVSDKTYPHTRYSISIRNTLAFEQDMEYLLKNFKVIGLTDLIAWSKGDKLENERFFHPVFAGGIREFREIVAPKLSEMGISASFFISPQYIDNTQLSPDFKASILIDRLHNSQAGSKDWEIYHKWSEQVSAGNSYYRKLLLNLAKNEVYKLNHLADQLSIDFSEYQKKHKPYLSIDDIKSLMQDGFTVCPIMLPAESKGNNESESQANSVEEQTNYLLNKLELDYKAAAFEIPQGLSIHSFSAQPEHFDISFGFGAGIYKARHNFLPCLSVGESGSIATNLKRELIQHHKIQSS